jgi:hypothetical protein
MIVAEFYNITCKQATDVNPHRSKYWVILIIFLGEIFPLTAKINYLNSMKSTGLMATKNTVLTV